MTESNLHTSWHKEDHAEGFDGWSRLSTRELKKVYESFNEILLFKINKASLSGRTFVEVGCATAELYRYMKRYHPDFQYIGFDISEPAIHRAGKKYPNGAFYVCDTQLSTIKDHISSPSVVFARDVVHHQPDPWASLTQMVQLATEAAILRIRTRDLGETVLDPELSCQRVYGSWVPFIVLNFEETVEAIKRSANVSQVSFYKHYQILGGHNGRYLPKECYHPETGTAETAVYVQLSEEPVSEPRILVTERQDSDPHLNIVEKGLRELWNLPFKR